MNRDQDRISIAHDLKSLGVRAGGPMLVHSSLRSLKPLSDGLEGIITGLLDGTEGGALLLPALSYRDVDWKHPAFDARSTPSCVGALPEYFRMRDGTARSLHLTHSVCGTGEGAERFLSTHHTDATPCGPHSPFMLLADSGGQILMLGCGLTPNTSMHGVEEIAEAPYLFTPGIFRYTAIDATGKRSTLKTRKHDFAGFTQRYDRVVSILEPAGALRKGWVKGTEAYLIEAAALRELCAKKIRSEPFFFVDRIEH